MSVAGSAPDSRLKHVGSKAALPASSKQPCNTLKTGDQKVKLNSPAMPLPMGSPYMPMSFPARSLFPMMPFGPTLLPGVTPAAAGKGASALLGPNSNTRSSFNSQHVPVMPPMMPMMPPCFPHPAQLQAMSAAAQALMAQASKTGMPFPPGMMMPPFLFPMQPFAVQQCQATASTVTSQPAQAGSTSPAGTSAPKVAASSCAAEDDDADCLEEQIEVDPETEQLFEKVAAMEREKIAAAAQAIRADSPCPSIHSACTRDAGCHPHSPTYTTAADDSTSAPVSAAVFEEAAVLLPAVAGTTAEDPVPVPWLTFAADDGVDDIDNDLAQLISLPVAKPAGGPLAADNVGATVAAMKRVTSVDSAFSSYDAVIGSVAAAVAGTPCRATAAPGGQKPAAVKPKGKLIKIKTTKGPASAAAAAAHRNSHSKPVTHLTGKPSTAAATGLGTVKSGIQKKASNSIRSSNLSRVKQSAPLTAAPSKGAAAQQQQMCLDPCLSILDELQSGLSDTCFGASCGDDMGIDSFEYLGGLLQEASDEDAWDGLLAGAEGDMELCSVLQA